MYFEIQFFFFSEGGNKDFALKEALLFMMSNDLMPLNTSEREDFRRSCKEAVPKWKPLHKNTGWNKNIRILPRNSKILYPI